jgi:glycosyltransferase involved in cell wall biosynthesis
VTESSAAAASQTLQLSIVIPALNEELGIAGIVERVLSIGPHLREAGIGGPEVIVVDDGSRDRTAEVVQRYVTPNGNGGGHVRLIRHAANRGYGAALKSGLARAQGNLIAFLDADGTYPPEHFPHLCQVALAGADVVIGSRMAGAGSKMPLTRRLGNLIFARLISVLGNQAVRDSASGMRVVRREILPRLYPLPDGLNFTPIMSLRAIHEGLRLVEVPIPYDERVGQSKLNVVRDGLVYTRSILWTALGYNPVRIFGALGLAGLSLSGLVGLWLAIARLQGVTTLGRWGVVAIFAALVAGVAGVSLFNLGTTFNYLVALFRKQPVHVGLFGGPIFNPPLEHLFGWLGLVAVAVGVAVAAAALALGLRGWPVERLWLYLVGSALFILIGLQFIISWVVIMTLEEISEREFRAQQDLRGGEAPAAQAELAKDPSDVIQPA